MLDYFGNCKDHGVRVAGLHAGTVYIQRHGQILWVRHLIARDQPWSGWTESVAGLALGPLARQLSLEVAFGHVIDHTKARHVVQRVFLGYVFCFGTNHYAQFNFPISVGRATRH